MVRQTTASHHRPLPQVHRHARVLRKNCVLVRRGGAPLAPREPVRARVRRLRGPLHAAGRQHAEACGAQRLGDDLSIEQFLGATRRRVRCVAASWRRRPTSTRRRSTYAPAAPMRAARCAARGRGGAALAAAVGERLPTTEPARPRGGGRRRQRVVNDFNQRSWTRPSCSCACTPRRARRLAPVCAPDARRAARTAAARRRAAPRLCQPPQPIAPPLAADAGRYLLRRRRRAARGAIRIRYLQRCRIHRLLPPTDINRAAAPSLPPPLPRPAAERASVLVVGAGVAGPAAARGRSSATRRTGSRRPRRRPADAPATAPRPTAATAPRCRGVPRSAAGASLITGGNSNPLTQLCRQLHIEMRELAPHAEGNCPLYAQRPPSDAARAAAELRTEGAAALDGDALVGSVLQVWWDGDSVWYTCDVLAYDGAARTHAVRYRDDGLEADESFLHGDTPWRFAADAAAEADAGGGGSGGATAAVAGIDGELASACGRGTMPSRPRGHRGEEPRREGWTHQEGGGGGGGGRAPKAEARRSSPPTAPPEPAAPRRRRRRAARPSGAADARADDAAAAPAPLGLSEAAAAEGLTLARSTRPRAASRVCAWRSRAPAPYQAQAWRGNRYQSLGHFVTAAEAALAYARVKSLGDGDDGKEEAKEEVKEEEGEAAPADGARVLGKRSAPERPPEEKEEEEDPPPRPRPPSNGCPACAGKHRAHTRRWQRRPWPAATTMKSLARTARMPPAAVAAAAAAAAAGASQLRGGGGGAGGETLRSGARAEAWPNGLASRRRRCPPMQTPPPAMESTVEALLAEEPLAETPAEPPKPAAQCCSASTFESHSTTGCTCGHCDHRDRERRRRCGSGGGGERRRRRATVGAAAAAAGLAVQQGDRVRARYHATRGPGHEWYAGVAPHPRDGTAESSTMTGIELNAPAHVRPASAEPTPAAPKVKAEAAEAYPVAEAEAAASPSRPSRKRKAPSVSVVEEVDGLRLDPRRHAPGYEGTGYRGVTETSGRAASARCRSRWSTLASTTDASPRRRRPPPLRAPRDPCRRRRRRTRRPQQPTMPPPPPPPRRHRSRPRRRRCRRALSR